MMFLTEFVGLTVGLPRRIKSAITVGALRSFVDMLFMIKGVLDTSFAFHCFFIDVVQIDADVTCSVVLPASQAFSRQFDTP